MQDQIDLLLNKLRQSPWITILNKSVQPLGILACLYFVYKIVEGFYLNSKSRKKAVYDNCALQAKVRVAN